MASRRNYGTVGSSYKTSDDGANTPESSKSDPADTHNEEELAFAYSESQKLGVTGSVFLILNKMIGTGIFSTPSGIFAATGSVGVCLFLWVIGYKSSLLLHEMDSNNRM